MKSSLSVSSKKDIHWSGSQLGSPAHGNSSAKSRSPRKMTLSSGVVGDGRADGVAAGVVELHPVAAVLDDELVSERQLRRIWYAASRHLIV